MVVLVFESFLYQWLVRWCPRQRAVLLDFGLRKIDPRLGSRIVSWMFLGYFGGIKTDFEIFEVKKLFFETLWALKHALEWRFLHQMASARCRRQKLLKKSQISWIFNVKFKFKDGFRTVCKLIWDHLGAFDKVFEISQVKKLFFEPFWALEDVLEWRFFAPNGPSPLP